MIKKTQKLARPGQTLVSHLKNVSERCSQFCKPFRLEKCGQLLGLLHDLGKFPDAWQKYLCGEGKDQKHSPEGVQYLFDLLGKESISSVLSAYVVYGHHGGLPDTDKLTPESSPSEPLPESWVAELKQLNLESEKTLIAFWTKGTISPGGINADIISMTVRFLFSALVDADRLDAEAAEHPNQAALRHQSVNWNELSGRFDEAMAIMSANVAPTPVNRARAEILSACLEAAEKRPGFFILDVPTGGGKTLSGMAFALKHLRLHGHRRILSVIPYTSIIEQTADKYKSIFGDSAVLEHHSTFESKYPAGSHENEKESLALENWDAPIIVTTHVQFFETLLGSGATQVRKLHNIAGSIILIDEVQMLPVEHFRAIIPALNLLASHFGCTVVLCSATMPDLSVEVGRMGSKCPQLEKGIPIIADAQALGEVLCRTRLENLGSLSFEAVVAKLEAEMASGCNQHLCIVNTKKRCRTLFNMLPFENKIHLSAAMCPAERTEVLNKIRSDLKRGIPLTVVATSLVEAGVDVDFPVVFRECAGLDSLAQAAGRCNREGLREFGKVYFFAFKDEPPVISQAAARNVTELLLKRDGELQLNPEMFLAYFREYFINCKTFDKSEFERSLSSSASGGKMNFETFGKAFKIIEDDWQSPVVVRYGQGATLIDNLLDLFERREIPSKKDLRRLQRYTVNLAKKEADQLLKSDCLREVNGILCQISEGIYIPGLGLQSSAPSGSCQIV